MAVVGLALRSTIVVVRMAAGVVLGIRRVLIVAARVLAHVALVHARMKLKVLGHHVLLLGLGIVVLCNGHCVINLVLVLVVLLKLLTWEALQTLYEVIVKLRVVGRIRCHVVTGRLPSVVIVLVCVGRRVVVAVHGGLDSYLHISGVDW